MLHSPIEPTRKLAAIRGAVDGGQTTGLAGVTEKQTSWTLKQKLWSWSRETYTIVDDKKNLVFKVSGKGKAFDLHRGMFFYNSKGIGIAYLCKKIFAMRPTYKLFTFEPNYEGQKSTYKQTIADTVFRLYRYAYIDSNLMSFLGEYHFKRFVTNKQTVDVLEAKGRFQISTLMKVDVRKSGSKEVIARIRQTSFFQFEKSSE